MIFMVPVFAFHAIALDCWATKTELTNKVVGMALQMGGGLLILHSINDNLGLFRGQSILRSISSWILSFPVVRETIVLEANASASMSWSAEGSVSARAPATSIDERIQHLEEDLAALRQQMQCDVAALTASVRSTTTAAEEKITLTSTRLETISKQIETAAVGGFKVQIFGVFLALYGAVTSVFA
ncbi:MAG: hypothetical protein MUF44_06100 [Hydrogenophaga sp.]|nr:hypothetical protein [Hydrogenophaga sp.]